jgi:alkylation response protein AidB-like acyl-CoA dehydrogenase
MSKPLTFPRDHGFGNLPDSELLNPRGYAPVFLRSVLKTDDVRVLFSPASTAEGNLEIVRQAAYHSVELALSLGITVSLFSGPVRRFAADLWRQQLEDGFLHHGMLGGMMITEPGCGTDIMACQTRCLKSQAGYELTGQKHWSGLTGLADYWLVLAKDEPEGKDRRFPSLNFFICRSNPESFKVIKTYGSAGLRSIPYGITQINAREGVLAPLLVGDRIKRFRQIHGILQRSRISITAITCGASQRIAADALAHVEDRHVFGRALAEYGQVQARIREIVASRDISEALFRLACRKATLADTTPDAEIDVMIANAVKVVCTDLAFASATSASQLLGGDSYRTDTYIGRATADLRPFRIFEGSNDVLCEAVWAAVEKAATKGAPAFRAIMDTTYQLTGQKLPKSADLLTPGDDQHLPQGLRCLGGRILANAFCLQWSLEQSLPLASCHPLLTRMNRDFSAIDANGLQAGLVEY